MESLYEELNGSYVEIEEVQIPALISTETDYEIGFWGQKHKEYLKDNHRVIYYNLLTQGKLNSYLHKIDTEVKEQYDSLVKQLVEKQGVNEKFKAENQILWVQMMNNIANQAREIIYSKYIICYDC